MESYQNLYQEMLLTLEPMVYLPFDLSIDFESRQVMNAVADGKPQPSPTSLINFNVYSEMSTEGSSSTSPSLAFSASGEQSTQV